MVAKESKSKSVVLFTFKYPYGSQEVFLENEMEYLSKELKQIFIVPLFKDSIEREVPFENVKILEPVFTNKIKYLLCTLNPLFIIIVLKGLRELGFKKNRLVKIIKQAFIITNLKAYLRLMPKLGNSFFWYFYWGTNSVNVLPFLKTHPRSIARLHGFDLYGDDVEERPAQPFRNEMFSSLDQIHVITRDGIDYLSQRYPKFIEKYKLSRLGVPSRGINPCPNDSSPMKIVTCSNIYPIKRLELLAEALEKICDEKIHWVHFGSGEDDEVVKLKRITDRFMNNLKFELKGQISNPEIMKYYAQEPIDLFMNTSISEGLPVSIMEALSFGIPVYATNSGGIREIMSDSNGKLLDISISSIDLSGEILDFIKNRRFDVNLRREAHETWKFNVDADTNYNKFIQNFING